MANYSENNRNLLQDDRKSQDDKVVNSAKTAIEIAIDSLCVPNNQKRNKSTCPKCSKAFNKSAFGKNSTNIIIRCCARGAVNVSVKKCSSVSILRMNEDG